MNLTQPSTWPVVGGLFGGRKSNDPGSSVVVRAGHALGIWQDALGGFIPREVNPHLYEAMREALPILDATVERRVELDGIIRVQGGNDALVQRIENELLANIPVNDAEAGLQAFYASQGGEMYEQGLGLGEMIFDRRGRELIGLRVADSKGVAFARDPQTFRLRWYYRPPVTTGGQRRDGTDQVESVIRRGGVRAGDVIGVLTAANYVELDPRRMVYAAQSPEADNPYGVSVFRSMEFTAQILLKIQNATGQVWDRFGDPPFQLTYKVKNRAVAGDTEALKRRRQILADDLAKVLNAKRAGNSADFVQAIGADDDIVIKVIGAAEQILEIEMPARHMLEQIVAKADVPAWLLGLQWTTAERLAQQQSEMALQSSKTRWERRLPGLRRIVESWLRGRGETWKAGDWELYQELPNLHDELKRAQAAFLNAQTEFMQRGGASGGNMPPTPPGTDQGAAKRAGVKGFRLGADGSMDFDLEPAVIRSEPGAAPFAQGAVKSAGDGEPWAENDPELPKIEDRAIGAMLQRWNTLRTDTLRALGLAKGAKQGEVVNPFDFTSALRQMLAQLADEFEIEMGSEEGGLLRGMLAAWRRGVENAATELDVAAAIDTAAEQARLLLRERGMTLVRTVTTRAYRNDILQELADGLYNGLSPAEVAQRLRDRFGAHDYDWERLARSEIAQAQVLGKEAEYRELGVEEYDYVTAGDSKVSAICRANAAGGPYKLGEGPLPMRDSHPNCRCSIRGLN